MHLSIFDILFSGSIPYINTIDPDIIKEVYVKNFEVFGDMVDNPNYDDKMKTIDLAQGSDWKNIRKVLSPTFTSGKLKGMLEPMTDVGNKAMKHLDKLIEKNEPIAMKNFFQVFHISDGLIGYPKPGFWVLLLEMLLWRNGF